MIGILIILGFFLFLIFIVWRNIRFDMSWKSFAKKLGLAYHHKGFFDYKINGNFRNHYMALEVEISGDGGVDSSLSVDTSNPRGISLHIHPKFLKKVAKKDIVTVNTEFDRIFRVRGNNELEIKKILDSDMQTKILALNKPKRFNVRFSDEIDCRIVHNHRQALYPGGLAIKDIGEFITITNLLIEIADKTLGD